MFEQQLIVTELDMDVDVESELHSLDSLLQPMAAPPLPPTNRGFQLPRRVWVTMLGCYATFFAAISLATGGSGPARFAIVISVIYTMIYFGVARIGTRQAGPEEPSPLEHGERLDTWTGLMDAKSVYGQVLIVPFAIAIFGISLLAIIASVS